ncbi:hypothetical protein JCM10207_003866 [Rhodosporidiobolus poonsookiae]
MLKHTVKTFTRAKSTISAPAATSAVGNKARQIKSDKDNADTVHVHHSHKRLINATDPAAEYQRRLEERFGGAEASALGNLVDGQPDNGMSPGVKRNLFRVI